MGANDSEGIIENVLINNNSYYESAVEIWECNGGTINLYNSTIISAGLGEDASFDIDFLKILANFCPALLFDRKLIILSCLKFRSYIICRIR